jgi:non-ribosomal peptide synthetase-like protein
MVMARFCARVRKRPDLPSPSIKDVYRNPTLRSLATALGGPGPVATPPASAVEAAPVEPVIDVDPAPADVPRTGTAAYVLCGALQLLFFLGYCFTALATTTSFDWISAGTGFLDVYRRSVVAGGVSFVALCLLPIVAKWVLVGRWRPGEIRIWSLGYVRFWLVKILVRANPLVLFVGSPLYVLYLRALGARVGRGVAVFSRSVPVCTDLLTIGDGAVVSQEALFSCYRARAGRIETGRVTVGRDAFVAEATVIDIDTVLGDGAQLGRSSSLHAGQVVPDGERWHGSPARPTHVDYRAVGPARCGTLRRIGYSVAQLLTLLLLWLPLGFGGVALLIVEVPRLNVLLGADPPALTTSAFYRDALIGGSVLFWGVVVGGLLVVMTVPRVLALALPPDRTHRLYGVRWSLHRTIVRLTNVRFFTRIFGDSSYIVGYLRRLGYDLGRVVQSGSNFGTEVRHEIPNLCSVGSGTMVADGLFMLNSSVSSTSFRVSRVSIGARNFLGNRIAYPAQGRTGENCLLATKVMVPVDGPVREGVGLLGSPWFEIPRSVERDLRFDGLKSAGELNRRLRAKNLHNIATMGLFLLTRWLYVIGLVLSAGVALDLYDRWGTWSVALDVAFTPLFTVAYFVLVERAVTRRHPLRPLYCSIYEHDFWQRERYWKVPAEVYLQVFNGTPFKNIVMRVLGARVGRRVFDDGCYLTERSLCTIGDDCTLNVGSVVQCHSQEDGTFKSDRTTIDAGVTVGVGAFVHYGVTMGDGAELAADSFLMKGEAVPAHARWGGNPAVAAGS